MKKKKDIHSRFFPKAINLLLEEEKSEAWEKAKKIVNRSALVLSSIFLLVMVFTFLYSWRISSYGASLEERATQTKQKISSLNKEEKTYLSLKEKIKNAEAVLNSQSNIRQFLKEVEPLIPSKIKIIFLTVDKAGKISVVLPPLSLSEIENLNENFKKAIAEGKILTAEIGGITKEEENLYRINLSFQIKKSGD